MVAYKLKVSSSFIYKVSKEIRVHFINEKLLLCSSWLFLYLWVAKLITSISCYIGSINHKFLRLNVVIFLEHFCVHVHSTYLVFIFWDGSLALLKYVLVSPHSMYPHHSSMIQSKV